MASFVAGAIRGGIRKVVSSGTAFMLSVTLLPIALFGVASNAPPASAGLAAPTDAVCPESVQTFVFPVGTPKEFSVYVPPQATLKAEGTINITGRAWTNSWESILNVENVDSSRLVYSIMGSLFDGPHYNWPFAGEWTQGLSGKVETFRIKQDFGGAADGQFSLSITRDGETACAEPVVTPENLFGGFNPAIKNAECCFGEAADPITTGTGNFYRTWTDFSIPGRGTPLSLSRTYNAQARSLNGAFGYGWQFNWGTRLINIGNDYIVRQENGSEVTFVKNGSTFVAPQRVNAVLAQVSNGFTFTRNNTEVFAFDSSGQLISVTDPNGYETTLSRPNPNSLIIEDEAGRQLSFSLSGGRIVSAQDPIGRTASFAYSGSGDLVESTDADGNKWTFTYDSQHRMTTMREPRFYGDTTTTPSPVVTNVYDGSDRVISQTDQLGRTTTLDYSTVPGSTIVTDPKGDKTRDAYDKGLRVSRTSGYGSAFESTWQYAYDPFNLGIVAVSDPKGNVTQYSYDRVGNRVSETDALGNRSTATYTGRNQPLSVTNSLGNRVDFAYDGAGNLTSINRVYTDVSPPQTFTSTLQYTNGSKPGDVTKVINAEGEEATFTYNNYGDITSVTDDIGNKATLEYNGPVSIGWVVKAVAPKGNVAGGSAASHTTSYIRDDLGRVLETRDPLWTAANPNSHRTQTSYDANGNVLSQTDGSNKTTTFSYNSANELQRTTRPDATTLDATYWPDGSLKTQTDGRSKTTNYSYDPQGRLASLTDALSRVTSFAYDVSGNLTSKVDPGPGSVASRTTSYSYDAGNRQVAINYANPATPDVTFAYDSASRRTQMTDGTGTTSYSYDSLGRLSSTANGAGQALSFTYDKADRQTTITYPGNKTVSQDFDDAGRMVSVLDWAGNFTEYQRDANGNVTNVAMGNNIDRTVAYDNTNLPVNNKYQAGWDIGEFVATRNGSGQVTQTKVWGDLYEVQAGRTYQYDQVNRLSQVSGTNALYDSGDNPVGVIANKTPGRTNVEGATTAISQAFDDANQLTSSAHDGGSTYGYDSRGNRTSTTPAMSAALTSSLTYDQANRLSGASTAGAPSGTYESNVMADSPTGYWRLNDSSGNIVDSSGNGRNGTSSGWFTTKSEGAVKGDPSNKSFHYGNNDAQNWIPSVTVNAAANGKNTVELLMQWDGWNGMAGSGAKETVFTFGGEYGLTFNDGAFGFSTKADGSDIYGIDGDAAKGLAQRWAHVVAVFNNGNVNASELYIDGVKQTLSQKKGTPVSKTAAGWATIGANGSSANDFNGRVDEVSTYNKSLNQTDVTEHFKAANNYSATYEYDGTGLRQSKTVNGIETNYLWNTSSSLPLPLSDGRYNWVYGADGLPLAQIDNVTNETKWMSQDTQGNTRMLLRNDGFMVGSFDYTASGVTSQTVGAADSPLKFQSQLQDAETGFTYLRARYLDPKTNQFLSVDPMAAQTWSRYTYAENDGVNYSDPTGNVVWFAVAAAAWGVYEVGSAAADIFIAASAWADPGASTGEKWGLTGLAAIGAVAPGGGYGTGAKAISKASGRIRQTVDLDALSAAGSLPAKGGLSVAGRSYQKHMNRGELPVVPGKSVSEISQDLLDDILTHPGSVTESVTSGRGAGGLRMIRPDGTGATFNADGSFIYFGQHK